MTLRDQITAQALTLSPEDRLYVADQIDRSVEDRCGFSPEYAAQWSAEIDRRLEAYERGEMPAEDARVALNRLREMFKPASKDKIS